MKEWQLTKKCIKEGEKVLDVRVLAPTAAIARDMAESRSIEDQPEGFWINPNLSLCQEVLPK